MIGVGSPAATNTSTCFFRRYAGQNQFRHQIGATYVLAEGPDIGGFATVAAHSLKLPDDHRGSLPDYQLPVLLIARLGVDERFAGRGIGRRLLQGCCVLAVEQADRFGCCGVVTEAKGEVVPFYRKFGFIPVADVSDRGTQLHFLALRHFEPLVRRAAGKQEP